MLKINRARILDKVIVEVEKMPESSDKYKILMFLDEIQHNENMINIDKEFVAWLKGFGSAIFVGSLGVLIGTLLSKYK